jgi:redox-sensitive bicupin YhaK (pirin superfamily)
MTAGRGIVHGEHLRAEGKVRLLQLWLVLPRRDRWTEPAFQDLRAARVPVRREPGVEARVYSGESDGLRSPVRNHVPVTIVEGRMQPGAAFEQTLPASYNGFLFVIDGSVAIGSEDQGIVRSGQVGWFDAPVAGSGSETTATMVAGDDGARFLLYAGEPQRDAIVSHGPFIADSEADVQRLYAQYRAGRFVRMSELAAPARRDGAIDRTST